MNDREALSSFIRKRRKTPSVCVNKASIKEVKLPWYKRPLDKSEFTTRIAKNGKYYIKHAEWSKRIWVGPYSTQKEADEIIESYVIESLKDSIARKVNNKVHSVTIDNENDFW